MKRRTFLHNSSILTSFGLLAPSLFLTSCKETNSNEPVKFDGKVLVIGAGVAGLYAGNTLQTMGIDFQILEASSSIGGRVGWLTGFAKFPIDLGAQWLHGNSTMFASTISSSNTQISLDDSEVSYWFQNSLVSTLPKNINIFETSSAPDVSFRDYAIQQGLNNEYLPIVESFAATQGSSSSRLSVYFTNKEEELWSSGTGDYKFQDTYSNFLFNQVNPEVISKVIRETPVVKIDYSQSTIIVTDSNNKQYTADKILLTVPISILKNKSIEFIPPLPTKKQEAFDAIGMDAGMKVFLRFSQRFYSQNTIGGNVCATYIDDSIGKKIDDYVLLAFVMGDQAEKLSALNSHQEIVSTLLKELDTIYNGNASKYYQDSFVKDWSKEPYIQGAYSYSTIGIGNARSIAAEPIGKKIYFAGEAMNLMGHHQTVQGAVETGILQVQKILFDEK
jgi:lysine-specific histone demethylase 1B